jgi:uncharacterized protein (TIGR00369 family)
VLAKGEFDPERDGWERVRYSGFTRLVGPIWRKIENGRPRYGFTVEDKHDNTVQRAHGGMVMAFADEAMGLAVFHHKPESHHLTVSFTTQFIDAARIGEFVEIEPEVVRSTRSLAFMEGRVHAATRTIATCSGVWKTRRNEGSAA